MKYLIKHPFKAFKTCLPKSMFGRALLILMAPLVLVGTLSAYIFFDNHWDHVTKVLADTLAGEISTLTALHNAAPKNQELYKTLAGTNFKINMNFFPKVRLNPTAFNKNGDPFLNKALSKKVFIPYTYTMTRNNIEIRVQAKDGVLEFITSRKRLLSKTFYLFIMWVGITSAFFLLIASIFMHNQVKPLRRLAIAAERFGKGRSFPDFKPEGATELQKDVDEMGQMLEGYLTFARGEGLEETSETDMNALLLDAIQGRSHMNKKVHYESQPLSHLHIKPQALKRCLTNLINNATRYGQEVWINARSNSESLLISVEDDGPGIPQDKMEEVFKPFFRLDRSRNVSTGGVGLGLTIARDIARSHGGDIHLSKSKAHGGLCMSLILPQ